MYKKNTAGQFIHFQGVDASTNGIKSGVTWTVRRCIDGTFADATGTVTEDGSTGWYKFEMSQADTNGNNIGFNFTGTGAIPQTVNIVTDGAPPAVNLTQIDGQATSGNNATLNLKKLNVVNNSGNAFEARSTGGSGSGAIFRGNSSGYGVDIQGGGNNVGLQIDGGITAGAAVMLNSHGTNHPALSILSDDGPGIYLEGVNGNGIEIYGSAASITAPQGILGSDSEDLSVTNITDKVWDEATAGHTTAGTTGKALTDAGSAGDPWGTALPGAYSAGTAGKIIGDNLNATVSSRATQSSVDDLPTNAELATALDAIPTAAENAAEVLSAATANPIDANVQEVNDVTLTGNGTSGSPWGPA